MKIALVNVHTQEKTFITGMDNKPAEWATQAEAEYQIECFKSTCGNGPREPVNFRYVIEP